MPDTPLNPDALEADSLVSEHERVEALETPERDYPAYGSVTVRLHHSKRMSTNVQLSRRTAESLRDQLNELLTVAQPVVNSVESIPAQVQVISWEEEPEHECWKLAPDETFVGLIVKSDRAWSPADKYTLSIERPEVKP